MKNTGKIKSGFMVMNAGGCLGTGERPRKNEPDQKPERKPKVVLCPAGYWVEEKPMLPVIPKDVLTNAKKKARDCDCEDCRNKPEPPMFYTPQNARRK